MNDLGRERQIIGELRGIQVVLDMDNKKIAKNLRGISLSSGR